MGSPATLSNALAAHDETPSVTCCSVWPKQHLLTLYIPRQMAQTPSHLVWGLVLQPCFPLHSKAPRMGWHPSKVGWDPAYCTRDDVPEPLLAQR